MSATWIACSESLPDIDVAEGLLRSRVVLGCDKYGNMQTVYLQTYESDEYNKYASEWRLTGPDGYFWDPLYWCELPAAPGKEVKRG